MAWSRSTACSAGRRAASTSSLRTPTRAAAAAGNSSRGSRRVHLEPLRVGPASDGQRARCDLTGRGTGERHDDPAVPRLEVAQLDPALAPVALIDLDARVAARVI